MRCGRRAWNGSGVFASSRLSAVTQTLLLAGGLAAVGLASGGGAFGHDPSEPFADWYNALRRPAGGSSCCGYDHDCSTVEYRISPPHNDADSEFEAFYDAEWHRIPEADVVRRHDNPTGSGV